MIAKLFLAGLKTARALNTAVLDRYFLNATTRTNDDRLSLRMRDATVHTPSGRQPTARVPLAAVYPMPILALSSYGGSLAARIDQASNGKLCLTPASRLPRPSDHTSRIVTRFNLRTTVPPEGISRLIDKLLRHTPGVSAPERCSP